ncbi:hypothetical protein QQM79_00305 [Marinobacteraceae bacterium S3BR75-40.1]
MASIRGAIAVCYKMKTKITQDFAAESEKIVEAVNMTKVIETFICDRPVKINDCDLDFGAVMSRTSKITAANTTAELEVSGPWGT